MATGRSTSTNARGRRARAELELSRLLLAGRWLPVTKRLSFVAATLEQTVETFMAWRGRWEAEERGYPMRIRQVYGDLEALLDQLEPLITVQPLKTLFIPTTPVDGQPYTCVLEDSAEGADNSIVFGLVTRGLRAIAVSSAPATMGLRGLGGQWYGMHKLGIYWPDSSVRRGANGRVVGIGHFESHRRWDFIDMGPVQAFERTERYGARKVTDRFDQELLIEYVAQLGLRPFDADFYAPDRHGVIVEATHPPLQGQRRTTLEAVRADEDERRLSFPL